MITYIQYQQKVLPHGVEWKLAFSKLIDHFIQKNIFPDDIRLALQKTLSNAAATTCSDPVLFRVLLEYDHENTMCLVEQLMPEYRFKTEKGQTFGCWKKDGHGIPVRKSFPEENSYFRDIFGSEIIRMASVEVFLRILLAILVSKTFEYRIKKSI